MAQKEWYEDNKYANGYKWSIRAKFGVVEISEEELFSRLEFAHFRAHSAKFSYAMNLGWRFNIDNQKWYRIKGH